MTDQEITNIKSKALSSKFGSLWKMEQSYHSPLPAEVQRWYAYVNGGGHSILCLLVHHVGVGAAHIEIKDPADYLVPVPVRTALRGYRIVDDYIVVDLPYDSVIGLRTPPDDDEY